MARLNLNMYDVVTQDKPETTQLKPELSLDSPALSLFDTASDGKPLLVNSEMSALDAVKLLSSVPGNVHFVVNAQNRFQGIIELENLNAIEFIKRTSNGYTRDELLVSDFMIPRRVLRAFDLDELKQAQVRDVIESLNETGAQYSLVVDRVSHRIRNVLSRDEIERQLHIKIGKSRPGIMQMLGSLHN